MSVQPVKVPRELVEVPAVILEEYVRCRMLQFIKGFGQRIAQLQPLMEPGLLDRAVRDTLEVLPLPDYGQVPVEMLELQLVFRHDCIALGCTELQCVLCQHNSQRRCTMNFNKKYLVNDRMLARCGAQIRIEVVDRATGKMFDGELPDVYLEMFVLDGAAYDQKFVGDGNGRVGGNGSSTGSSDGINCDAALDECGLLMNNKGQPLLGSTNTGKADNGGRLLLQTTNGRLMLPDLFVTDSSEALLSGRKPPFKLVVRARHRDGRQLAIRHAVSEPFVVATRRVRASHKVEIPSMDDPVSKLDHMGKETVKKLLDLRSAAAQIGVDLSALEPELNRIEKVGEFRALALRVEGDGHLRQQLQTLLKLAKEKWEEAAEHAKRAVVPDNRMRAWYADRSTLELGLLFPCRLGVVNLKRPEALLQRVVDASGASKIKVVGQQQQNPMQRDTVRQLLPQADASWWAPGHVGWTIFPADTDTFEANAGQMPVHLFDLAVFDGTATAAAAAPSAVMDMSSVPASPSPLPLPGGAYGIDGHQHQQQHHHQHQAQPRQDLLAEARCTPPPLQQPQQQYIGAAPAVAAASYPPQSVMTSMGRFEMGPAPAASGSVPMMVMPADVQAMHSGLTAPTSFPSSSSELELLMQQQHPYMAGNASAVLLNQPALELTVSVGSPQLPVQQQQLHPGEQLRVQAGAPLPVLPTAEELQVMLESNNLTDDVVAAIANAFERNQCPPALLAVIQQQQQRQQQEQEQQEQEQQVVGPFGQQQQQQEPPMQQQQQHGIAATATKQQSAAAAAMGGGRQQQPSSASQPQLQQPPRPTLGGGTGTANASAAAAGLKRTYSAAAGSASSSGSPKEPSTGQGTTVAQPAGLRPNSFSGAIDVSRAAARAVAALDGCIPEHDVMGSDGLTVIGAAAADLPEVDASAPHPFYEQLKRDSLKSRSRCGSKKSALEAAADAAVAAVDGAAAAAQVPDAADLAEQEEGQGSMDLPNLPYGQSLEIEGLRMVYPSSMLDALTAETAAHQNRHVAAGGGGAQGAAGAAAGLAKAALPPASAPAAAVAHAAVNGYHMVANSTGMTAAAAAAGPLGGELDHMTGPVLGEGLSAMQISLKDCPSLLALGAGGPLDFTFSKTGLSSKGMSMELPSMLLQVLSGSAEGVQGLGPGSGGPGGPSAAKKQLQLADSGLANMLSMGQALEEAVSMEEQQMQQA